MSSSAESAKNYLYFEQLSSEVDIFFWLTLIDKKLNEWKLTEEPVNIRAIAKSNSLKFTKDSFEPFNTSHKSKGECVYKGNLYNSNTKEGFMKLDKNKIFRELCDDLWASVLRGEYNDLNRFLLFTFVDIKKYKVMFWLCVPSLHLPCPAVVTSVRRVGEINTLMKEDERNDVFFISDGMKLCSIDEIKKNIKNNFMVCFNDPSISDNPGWPLRNILVYLKANFDISILRLICCRNNENIEIEIDLPGDRIKDRPKSSGWEKSNGSLTFKSFDFGSSMDPLSMANSTVDLNLKLMKWRQAPSLNLDIITQSKCLLLGAGTLGCNVARNLIGWGVRKITFIDNGIVSASNVVRQPLFQFKDIGKNKAEAAAENMKLILPSLEVEGVFLNILMPDHYEDNKDDFDRLKDLFTSHDIVFLLTDSREARWLPIVFGVLYNKLVIDIALGFDSYVVMRHGTYDENKKLNAGCYFCNDVVAPHDSFKDRTLDQMCTVTRPGVASIASSYGVELMVSILQHPLRSLAPPHNEKINCSSTTVLGSLPHQIRGFVSDFSNIIVSGHAYDKCTACSSSVVSKMESDGYEFMKHVMKDSKILEKLTGLDELHKEVEALDLYDFSDFCD